MKNPEKSRSGNIVPSIADTALKMGEKDGGRFLYAVTNYLLYGVIPELDGTPGLIWGAIFPNLETTRKIALGRSKGGKASKTNNPNGRRGKGAAAPDGDSNADTSDGLPMDEEEESPKPRRKATPTRFAPPSVDEVQNYVTSQGYTINAAGFVDYYASKGWRVGSATMKDWKAAVRNWQRRERQNPTATAAQSTPNEHGFGVGEFRNSKGQRTYASSGVIVPDSAPPRPSVAHWWSEASNRWEKQI